VPTLEDSDVPGKGEEASAFPLTTIVMELVEGSSSNTYSLVPVSSKESQDLLLFNNKVIHEQELDGFSFSLRTLADEQEQQEEGAMGEGANVLPPISVMSSSTQSQRSEMSSVDSSLVPSSSRISYTETTTSGTSPGSRPNKAWIPAQCTICDRVFGRARYVMRHLKKIHLLDTSTKKAVQEGLMLLLPPVVGGDGGGGGVPGGDVPVAVAEDRQDYSLLSDNPFLSADVPHSVATHGSHHVATSHASDMIASAVEDLRTENSGSFYDANTLARNVSDDYPDLLDSLFDALDEKLPEKEENNKTIYVVPPEGSTVRHNLAMSRPSGRHRSIGKVLPGEKVRRGKQSSWPPQQSSLPPQQSSLPPPQSSWPLQQGSQSLDSPHLRKNSNAEDRLRSRKTTAVANAGLGNPAPTGIPTLTLELDDGSASSDAEDSFMDDEYYSDKPTTLKRRVQSDDESLIGKRARYEEEAVSESSSDESESQDDGCEYDSYEDSLLRRRHGIRQLLSVRLVDVQYAKWCWRSKFTMRRLLMKDTHIISAVDAAYGASNVVSCQLTSKTAHAHRDPSNEQGSRLLSPVVRLPRLRVSSLYPAGFDYRALFKGKAAMAESESVVSQILEEVLENLQQCCGSASF
jgi:hypothetical protein